MNKVLPLRDLSEEPERLKISSRSAESEEIDLTEVRRRFARSLEERIGEKKVTFVPLLYGATKVQMKATEELGISGIIVNKEQKLIYADNQLGVRDSNTNQIEKP